jgi:hypothetical protein
MLKKLAQIQEKFLNYLQTGDPAILPDIKTTDSFKQNMRLGIYQENYFIRLIDALGCDYPALYQVIGEDLFQQLAKQYVVQFPSHEYSLRGYGAQFADFIAQKSDKDQAYLAELARFELALVNAFDAEDRKPFDESALYKIPAEKWFNLIIDFHPSLQVMPLYWNTATFWKSLHLKQSPKHEKYLKPQAWMIWRWQYDNHFIRLTQSEAWAIQAAQNKLPFGEICQGLRCWVPQKKVILFATQLLKVWLQRGLVVNMDYLS